MRLKGNWFVLAIALLFIHTLPCLGRAQERNPAPQPQVMGSIPPVGVPLPSFKWETLDGEEFDSEDLLGQRTVMVLWAPTCAHSQAIIGDLPRLQSIASEAGAWFVLVNTDSSRVEAREALSGAIPDAHVVFATQVSEVLTHPQVDEGIEGPVVKAVLIPSFLVVDQEGIVQASRLWSSIEEFAEKVRGSGGAAGSERYQRGGTAKAITHFR